MSIPNLLSLARLFLAPAFAYVFLLESPGMAALALVISLLIEVTDYLDGNLARKYGWVSDFGKVFDPFTDSVSRTTMFLTFMVYGLIPFWMVLVIFYRDASIAFLRQLAANRNVVLSARPTGKIKAVTQAVAINLIVLANLGIHLFSDTPPLQSFLPTMSWWLMIPVVGIVVFSFFDYTISNRKIIQSYNP